MDHWWVEGLYKRTASSATRLPDFTSVTSSSLSFQPSNAGSSRIVSVPENSSQSDAPERRCRSDFTCALQRPTSKSKSWRPSCSAVLLGSLEGSFGDCPCTSEQQRSPDRRSPRRGGDS